MRRLGFSMGLLVIIAACGDDDPAGVPTTNYAATLTGGAEVPPVTTSATGAFAGQLKGNTFTYTMSSTGLSGSGGTAAHIHGPATASQTAGVLIDFAAPPTGSTGAFAGGTSASAQGSIDLSLPVKRDAQGAVLVSGDSLRKLLDAGLLYVNVHTAANGGGEIRGQIGKQ